MQEQLSKILELVDQLKQVDTAQVEAISHPLDLTQRLRPDKVCHQDTKQSLLKLAPKADDHYFLVPKVIE